MEWLIGLIGLIVAAGMVLNVTTFGFLHFLVLVVALAGVMLPLVVAMSGRTNVPIVFETTLWFVSGLLGLLLLLKAVIPSDTVFDSGWLALGGMLAMSFVLWRSVTREN